MKADSKPHTATYRLLDAALEARIAVSLGDADLARDAAQAVIGEAQRLIDALPESRSKGHPAGPHTEPAPHATNNATRGPE